MIYFTTSCQLYNDTCTLRNSAKSKHITSCIASLNQSASLRSQLRSPGPTGKAQRAGNIYPAISPVWHNLIPALNRSGIAYVVSKLFVGEMTLSTIFEHTQNLMKSYMLAQIIIVGHVGMPGIEKGDFPPLSSPLFSLSFPPPPRSFLIRVSETVPFLIYWQ
jgi:hypothetical protein